MHLQQPAFVGLADDGGNARIRAVMPGRRQRFAPPAFGMVVAAEQPHRLGFVAGARRDQHDRAVVLEFDRIGGDDVVEVADVAVRHVGHAVVGDDDEVDAASAGTRGDARAQFRQARVDRAFGGDLVRAMRAAAVPGDVDLVEVGSDQARTFCGGQIQPVQHLAHARIHAHGLVERTPLRRAFAVDFGRRTGPEQHCAALPRAFHRDPQRLAARPPAPVRRARALGHERAELRVAHPVVDHAVVVRAQAGDQRVVVGEGERRVRRIHPARVHAVGGDGVERGHRAAAHDVGAQGIDRHQHHGGSRSGRGRGAQAGAAGEQQREARDCRGLADSHAHAQC